MKRTVKISVCIILLIVMVVLCSCNVNVEQKTWADDFDLLEKVLKYVQSNYIGDIDVDKLDYITANALISSLDDFSYMSDNSIALASNSSIGISLKITKYNEYIVDYVYDGFPASEEKADGFVLRRGDFIYAINGERVEGASRTYFNELAAGGVGTELTYTIKRNGEIVGDYTYTKVEKYVPRAYYIGNLSESNSEVGYIRLSDFTETMLPNGERVSVSDEFDKCIDLFKNDNKKSLILDLRGNPGGSSAILAHIASYFVPLTVDENGKKAPTEFLCLEYAKSGERINVAVSEDNYLDIPLVILTNSGTASAAEALTGACRAFNSENTTVIGEKTFGKGVFQSKSGKIPDTTKTSDVFDDNYYITLVSGYYYIIDPNYEGGRYCIHKNGLVPDITAITTVVDPKLEKDAEIVEALKILSL